MYETVYLVTDMNDEEDNTTVFESLNEAVSHSKSLLMAYVCNESLKKKGEINLREINKSLLNTIEENFGNYVIYTNGCYKVRITMAHKEKQLTKAEKRINKILKGW